ncbi:MAG: hypothetical protein V1725_08040 [archaeon]
MENTNKVDQENIQRHEQKIKKIHTDLFDRLSQHPNYLRSLLENEYDEDGYHYHKLHEREVLAFLTYLSGGKYPTDFMIRRNMNARFHEVDHADEETRRQRAIGSQPWIDKEKLTSIARAFYKQNRFPIDALERVVSRGAERAFSAIDMSYAARRNFFASPFAEDYGRYRTGNIYFDIKPEIKKPYIKFPAGDTLLSVLTQLHPTKIRHSFPEIRYDPPDQRITSPLIRGFIRPAASLCQVVRREANLQSRWQKLDNKNIPIVFYASLWTMIREMQEYEKYECSYVTRATIF